VSNDERQQAGIIMGLIALIILGIIGTAVWQSSMDGKRWVLALVGALIGFALLIGGIAEAFPTDEEEK
jgi:hypothetical protein